MKYSINPGLIAISAVLFSGLGCSTTPTPFPGPQEKQAFEALSDRSLPVDLGGGPRRQSELGLVALSSFSEGGAYITKINGKPTHALEFTHFAAPIWLEPGEYTFEMKWVNLKGLTSMDTWRNDVVVVQKGRAYVPRVLEVDYKKQTVSFGVAELSEPALAICYHLALYFRHVGARPSFEQCVAEKTR